MLSQAAEAQAGKVVYAELPAGTMADGVLSRSGSPMGLATGSVQHGASLQLMVPKESLPVRPGDCNATQGGHHGIAGW